jgi:hypothetical protein
VNLYLSTAPFANCLQKAGAAGLLGLAFPAHTLAIYPGTNGTYDDEPGHEARHYSPFFASLVAEGSVPPIFSLALAANGSGESYIAFGGLPPVEVEGRLVSTPMLLVSKHAFGSLLCCGWKLLIRSRSKTGTTIRSITTTTSPSTLLPPKHSHQLIQHHGNRRQRLHRHRRAPRRRRRVQCALLPTRVFRPRYWYLCYYVRCSGTDRTISRRYKYVYI